MSSGIYNVEWYLQWWIFLAFEEWLDHAMTQHKVAKLLRDKQAPISSYLPSHQTQVFVQLITNALAMPVNGLQHCFDTFRTRLHAILQRKKILLCHTSIKYLSRNWHRWIHHKGSHRISLISRCCWQSFQSSIHVIYSSAIPQVC